MKEKILHLTAKSRNLSWEEKHLLQRNKLVLEGWEICFHDDKDNEKLVEDYFPQYLEKYRSISKGVAKADVSRIMYMFVWGGTYADTDYIWYKDPSTLAEFSANDVIIPMSREKDDDTGIRYGNAVFLSAPGQKIWLDFLEYIFESNELENLAENRIEKITGPEGFTSFLNQVGLDNLNDKYGKVWSAPRNIFHPYRKMPESVGRHYCWGSWRTKSKLTNIKNWIKRKSDSLLTP